MLPWVLLYGFTALLFNHSTWMNGADTTIEQFTLAESDLQQMPMASDVAALIVEATNEQMRDNAAAEIELVSPDSAEFTRQVLASGLNEDDDLTVVVDLNSGSGYVRKRVREEPDANDEEDEKVSLSNGVGIKLEMDAQSQFGSGVAGVLTETELDSVSLRGLPPVEFDAVVDGQKRRLRFSPPRRRGGGGGGRASSEVRGTVSIVGENPRDLTVRSYLLRLHTAHGYPVQTNARWFWAVCVDIMFASMCFWGLSGVVMWWQIKKTRRIGFLILVASAVVATLLAIGMHWQLVNG